MRTCLVALTASYCAGCGFDAAFERATEHHAQFASQSSGEPVELDTAEPAESEAIQTVTGVTTEETSDTTLGEPELGESSSGVSADDEAVILSWSASKTQVWQVGPVELVAVVPDQVLAVDVLEDGKLVTTLHPPELAHVWAVVGEHQDGAHTWTAVARTASSASAPAQVVVDVDVPPGGQPLWHEVMPEGDLSLAAAVATDGEVAVVIGYSAGALTLRRYADGVLTWSRRVTDWSALSAVKGQTTGSDVAIDGEGNIIVAGNVLTNNPLTSRRYLAKLTPTGALVWERLGAAGELANGVAVDDEGRVYLAGSAPVETDTKAMVWSWDRDGLKPWLAEFQDHFDHLHELSERATAVVRVGDRVIVVGEAQIFDDWKKAVPRSFVLQLTPGGEVKTADTWISVGDWGGRDGARDVIAFGDEYCLTGWGDVPARALTRCSAGLQPWWSVPHDVGTVARSISFNSRLEVVVAGELWLAKDKAQVWVEALVVGGDEVAWTFAGAPGQANGLDCGRWGPCVYVGVSALQWMVGALSP